MPEDYQYGYVFHTDRSILYDRSCRRGNGTKTIVSLATQLIILYVAFFGFAFVVYGGAVSILGKTSPVKFFKAIMPAALNAFGTCSSSATIPLSKSCVEDELGVPNQISSITIPLGATVNMDAVSILMSFMIMFLQMHVAYMSVFR